MKILLQDFQTGLYLGRRREWTQNPEAARAFPDRLRATAYKVWHRLPRACTVAKPATAVNGALRSNSVREDQTTVQATLVEVKLELGPGNALFIRGEGEGLTWHEGQRLTLVSPSTWVWRAVGSKSRIIFRLLLNDLIWAKGDEMVLDPGSRIELTPDFEWPEIPRISSSNASSRGLAIRPDLGWS